MKPFFLIGAALIGLASGFSASAQGAVGKPAARPATGANASTTINQRRPGTDLPTAVPPGAVPANATTPVGTSGQLYPGGVPVRNIDGGSQRADQPRSGQPLPGSQPTRTLNKSRTSSTQP